MCIIVTHIPDTSRGTCSHAQNSTGVRSFFATIKRPDDKRVFPTHEDYRTLVTSGTTSVASGSGCLYSVHHLDRSHYMPQICISTQRFSFTSRTGSTKVTRSNKCFLFTSLQFRISMLHQEHTRSQAERFKQSV
jgi:hypothetical protein